MWWCMRQEARDCNRFFRSIAKFQATRIGAHAGFATTGRVHLQHAWNRPTANAHALCGVVPSGGRRRGTPHFRPEPQLRRHKAVLPVCGDSSLASSV